MLTSLPPAPPGGGEAGRSDHGKKIRVLIVEDVPEDAELEVEALKAAGLDVTWTRVETAPSLIEEIDRFTPDLILSDYSLPRLNGMEALVAARERAPRTPFVVVTGSINEETAVSCMKAGAWDYVLKDHLGRLSFAVVGALELKRRREAQAQAEVQLRLQGQALEAAVNGILITDRSGTIEWVNPAFTAMTGYTREELIGANPRIVKSGNHREAFYRDMWATILEGKSWRGEIYNRRKDGSIYLEEATITPVKGADGSISHFVGIKQDISLRRRQEEEIRNFEVRDPLTRLPNRKLLMERLDGSVKWAQRGRPGSFLLLDLDNFKLVNDSVGHAAGDHLLVLLSQLLQEILRPTDILARLGGDEFGIILDEVPLEEARTFAEKLRVAVVEYRFRLPEREFETSISGGLCPIDGTLTPQAILSLADAALYSAKETGRDRIAVYRSEEERGNAISEASRWVVRVKDAVRTDRLILHYQPVVEITSGKAMHYEVLVRMAGEAGELVPPGVFLPVAERFGLMPIVDRWVVGHALEKLASSPECNLFVNVSGASLGDEGLLAWIERSIVDRGVAPGRLTFEITETATVSDLASVTRWIRRLKELGCQFALDDFGTGFSSFSYLRTLPVDFVKIDGSFIRSIDTDRTNRALVQAMTMVAHILGKEVVGEAVERPEEAAVLREIGVEYGQGWLWGRPSAELLARSLSPQA
jgi:diguanylate cyclase (GGDEF)-like protein/PAS domain S-box-containing protein